MTDELGPEARALLDAAREGMSPDAAAVRRVRARVAVAASGAGAGTALAVKLGIAGVIAALAAGAGIYAQRDRTTPVAPIVELATPTEVAVRTATHEAPPAPPDDDLITIEPNPPPAEIASRGVLPVGQEASPARSIEAGSRRVTPTARPGGRGAASSVESLEAGSRGSGMARPAGRSGAAAPERSIEAGSRGVTPTARPAGRGAAAPVGADLAREVELLDLAMAALRRGDAGNALHAVHRHAVETAGRGQLAEDAAAIEVEALCQLDDPSTSAKLAAFDTRFPRSAQRARLTRACRPR